ncbi:hypothetical protein DVH05_000892 [Phytophthora capsici]|nr:hypothetical protein DVH05_000892 [Phytophthora capsici]
MPPRRSALTQRSHLLLRPEDANGSFSACVYAQVTRIVGRWVWARLTGPNETLIKIAADTAPARVVPSAEATRHKTGLWLRQPVYFTDAGNNVRHGQVVSYSGYRVQVECAPGTVETCTASRLALTEPIVVLLLRSCPISTADLPPEGIERVHETILDRVVGAASEPNATTGITPETVLSGIPGAQPPPSGQTTCSWIEAASGETCVFSLSHALAYVFNTDGPGIAELTGLGTSFCRPPPSLPATTGRSRNDGQHHAPASVESFFASDDDGAARRDTSQSSRPSPRHIPVPVESPSSGERSARDRIAEVLSREPDLLDYFHNLENRDTVAAPVFQRGDAPADFARGSHTSFRPSAHQVRVHNVLTARHLSGKSPAAFVDLLISHRAVQFQPHPGVLTRLYDFQFGSRGLSIMHLNPIGQIDRMDWIMSGAVNMQNFAASVEAPVPKTPLCMADVQEALACFKTYASAFSTSDTVQLVDRMFAFVQELKTWQMWEQADLPYLVYWLNQILEDFRSCAERDSVAATAERAQVIYKLQTNNGDLQQLFQIVNNRRLLRLQPVCPDSSPVHLATSRPLMPGRPTSEQIPPLPAHDAKLVPRQGRLALCLRYLSNKGCRDAPPGSGRCSNHRRGHFVPRVLAASLKAYIDQYLGGLRPEHGSL